MVEAGEPGNLETIQAQGLMDLITYFDYRRGGRRGREKEEEIFRTGGVAQAEILLKLCKLGLSSTE